MQVYQGSQRTIRGILISTEGLIATSGSFIYVSASTTTVGIPGFNSMALEPDGHISERYWRRYTEEKESVGATY